MGFERVAESDANAMMCTRRMRFCMVDSVVTIKIANYGKVTRRSRFLCMLTEP